jgi:hypothetical protein
MILLVAGKEDAQAQWLATQWASHDARLLTPEDMSQSGWSFQSGSALPWTGVAGGQPFDEQTPLIGLVNLLGQVTEEHLPHIAPEDRSYVAHEMTAFLLTWQGALTCPVLNRPRPNCLVGPSLSTEAWLLLAASHGIRVRSITTSSHTSARRKRAEGNQAITVIGNRALGGEPELQRQALSLAHAAGVDLATFYFSTGRRAAFLGATLRPDLGTPEAAAALLQCLEEKSAC